MHVVIGNKLETFIKRQDYSIHTCNQ